MTILKYIPQKFYGFAIDEHGTQVFFHLTAFDNRENAVPPIVGESVDVEVDLQGQSLSGSAPSATAVSRACDPVEVSGTVETFDPNRGFGFISGDDGISYHLHQSEVVGGRLPRIQARAKFFAGYRRNRPRACHVEISSGER